MNDKIKVGDAALCPANALLAGSCSGFGDASLPKNLQEWRDYLAAGGELAYRGGRYEAVTEIVPAPAS